MTQAFKILTEVPAHQIIRNGGTGNWSASAQKVRQYPYVVCVRHGNRPASPNDVPHRAAFLIGRISDAIPTGEVDGKGSPRVFIRFDAYAEINVSDFWGDSQNPVGYVDDLEEAGIEVDSLNFIPVDETHFVNSIDKLEKEPGLSFAEAKQGIARRYGVDPQSVEIIVRG